MAPLVTLLVVFAVAAVVLNRKGRERTLAGRIALAATLLLTGVAHFTQTDALAAMVPAPLPSPVALVYVTGVLELALVPALLFRSSTALGWALAILFLALLPANVWSAIHQVGLGGHGAAYLWFRVPLQMLFIGWALWCTGALHFRRDALAT